jgi:prevent-host-death family protein
MASVGVRELKAQTSRILRRVREDGETITVTYRGRVVARVVPAGTTRPNPDPEALAAWWAEHNRLAAEISAHWPPGVSAVDAVRDVRRDL